MNVDLVLSSGFLAFARHAGFLAAVEERQLNVEALCGTSSGSVVAALWAAGHSSDAIVKLFQGKQLLSLTRVSSTPWRGIFSLQGFQDFLAEHLPARFEDLSRPLAVGVVDGNGKHQLLMDGPLAPAVTASCAMPWIFSGVDVGPARFADGGAADRLGLDAYRAWRPGKRALAHWVDRSAGKDVETNLDGVTVVRTPRSGAAFWSLGDVAAQTREARGIALEALKTL